MAAPPHLRPAPAPISRTNTTPPVHPSSRPGAHLSPRGHRWRELAIRLVAVAALASGALYLGWRIGFSAGGSHPVLFVLLLCAELLGWLNFAFYAYLTWHVPPSDRPTATRPFEVDLFVCTYDEPLPVLRATLLGCRAVRYPHTTWLLDDGRRPEVAGLAAELGARYLTRPDNLHAKAGNINNALAHTHGELIAVLDADHVPKPDFLDAVVGYFDDADVALVQTPHEFFNQDSIQHTRRDRHEQALFFRVLCPGKDRRNSAFWCGSAAVLRRRALQSVDGVRYETIAEDFHTTIALHQQGWRTRYHDEVLVEGRAPHDLASFLLQRDRWARGNLRVLRTEQNPLTARGLTLHQRLNYTASLVNYLAGPQRFITLVVLAASLLTGEVPLNADASTLLALWAPATALSLLATVVLGRGRVGLNDSVRFGMMTMSIYTMAVASLVSSSSGRFKVTPKQGGDRGGATVLWQLWLLTAIGLTLVIAAALRTLEGIGSGPLPEMSPVATGMALTLAAYECAQIGRLITRLFRRRQLRNDYRLTTTLPGRLGGSLVRVVDVTPGGLGVIAPVPCETSDPVTIHLTLPSLGGGGNDLHLVATPRSCSMLAAGAWRIGLRLDDLDARSRNALTEYCYVLAGSGDERRASRGAVEHASSIPA